MDDKVRDNVHLNPAWVELEQGHVMSAAVDLINPHRGSLVSLKSPREIGP